MCISVESIHVPLFWFEVVPKYMGTIDLTLSGPGYLMSVMVQRGGGEAHMSPPPL